jgi:AcrR family transcriptional regulator
LAPAENHGRSSAERLAETRTRLLDAVVETLAECGYAGTSTTEIARRSGLSRGAQLHHFGTKDQMMIATVEYLAGRTTAGADTVALIDRIRNDEDRIRAALEFLTEYFIGPRPAAYIELWVASRANPQLIPALRETDVILRANVRALFGEDLVDHAGPEFEALLDLTMYALRGMALDAHLSDREEREARKAIILGLSRYLESASQGVDH